MSGPAPMLNQLHKMAMMRKRMLISDNELYEMMRSRQVYHVQIDLQNRLSETLRSLEHDRELALAGILSRKLVFLKQAGKRERKRNKLVDVKKEMDDILRDSDLERLGDSLNEVWDLNQPIDKDGDEVDENDPSVADSKEPCKEKYPSNSDISVDGSGKYLKRIEKGVKLYLAATDARAKDIGNRDNRRVREIRANQLPSIVVNNDSDDLDINKNNKITPQSPKKVTRFLPIKGDRQSQIITKGRSSDKHQDTRHATNDDRALPKTFETETPETNDFLKRADGTRKQKFLTSHEDISKGKLSESELERNIGRQPSNSQNPALLQNERVNDQSRELNGRTSHLLGKDRRVPDKSQSDRSKVATKIVNQSSALLKPLPPYLKSKPSHNAKASTNLASDRASMERTVTMIFVEDSDVKTPKSSFDIDAWLGFMRQKKGYSATLNDGPLDGLEDKSNSSGKAADSKRNVKFAIRKKKLKALRPSCKTCRDRAMDWFKEFSKSDRKSKRPASSNRLNPLKNESLPESQTLSSRRISAALPSERPPELPRLARETSNQLLHRIREDSKVLQEKVQHLCTDAYWEFWNNGNTNNDAKS